MAHRAALIERVLFVRFLSQPDLGDFAAITREVSNARSAVTGGLNLCFVLWTEGAELPAANLRDAINRFVSQSLALADALDLVISGDGAEAMFLRTIWRGLVGASRWHGKVFVHTEMAGALSRIAEAQKIDPVQLAARIESARGLSGASPSSSGRNGDPGTPQRG